MKRQINSLIFLSFMLACLLETKGFAQSMSDLDLGGFEHETANQQVQSHTNPFSSGVSSAEELAVEDLQLTGIVYKSETEGFALISGYLVKVGDRIAGYKVDLIEQGKVKLRRLDEVIGLSLGGGI